MSAPDPRPELPDLDLVERIAKTNLNEVWRGVRRSTREPVAVKLSNAALGPDMLRQEAEIVQALVSRGVTGVVAAEYRSLPIPHMILPWKGGRTLRDQIQAIKTADDRSRTLTTFLHAVASVAAAHREGFLHGDLKPENILLDSSGRPWLTDFGMARAIRTARLESHLSLSMSESDGGWGGTLNYMPPEGLQGEPPSASWDVYALGVMLHEILLGRRPDRAATPENLKRILPEQVVQVLLSALAHSPADRYRTAGALARDLDQIRIELTATGPLRWLLRGRRAGVVGLAAFFVALRYFSVIALLTVYAGILISVPFSCGLSLLGCIPFLLFHVVIRWEGPETNEEARLRSSRKLHPRG